MERGSQERGSTDRKQELFIWLVNGVAHAGYS